MNVIPPSEPILGKRKTSEAQKRNLKKLSKPKENKKESNKLDAVVAVSPQERRDPEEKSILFRFLFTPTTFNLNLNNSIESFPTSMTALLNSGDFNGLNKLVNQHLDQRCDISVSYSQTKLSCAALVQFFEYLNDVHPDRIMHLNKSELYGNRILACTYIKFTDCKPLYDAVASMITDPIFSSYFPKSRADLLKRKMRTDSRPEAERRQLEALLESDNDLVVYGCVQTVLTLDATTHKGVGLQLMCDFTSAHVADVNCC